MTMTRLTHSTCTESTNVKTDTRQVMASHGRSWQVASIRCEGSSTNSFWTKSLLSRNRIQPHGSSLGKSRLEVMRNEEHIGTYILTVIEQCVKTSIISPVQLLVWARWQQVATQCCVEKKKERSCIRVQTDEHSFGSICPVSGSSLQLVEFKREDHWLSRPLVSMSDCNYSHQIYDDLWWSMIIYCLHPKNYVS